MKYFLDTEFNEFGGELISLALVREDGFSTYLATKCAKPGAWVAANVIPVIEAPGAYPKWVEPHEFAFLIAAYLQGDEGPTIIVDWPDDIRYFCQAIITGPGTMAPIPRLRFDLIRIGAYPTTLPGAIQHNAWWDAMALRHLFLS